MGLFDKILKTIAPDEEAGYEEQEYVPDQTAYIPRDPRTQEQTPATVTTVPVKPQTAGTSVMGSAIEMKVVKPDRYEAVAATVFCLRCSLFSFFKF